MAGDKAQGVLGTALEELVRRLRAELDLKTAEVWDGPWRALADAGRLSVAMPAALVAVNALEVAHLARPRFHPGGLRAATAGNPPHEFPAPHQGAPTADPPTSPPLTVHARVELGVTMLASDASASDRAARVAHLAEAALPVLAGFALEEIRGTNLYTKALYGKGLAAFMLIGRRDIELAPGPPGRVPPEQVEAIETGPCGARETVYARSAA